MIKILTCDCASIYQDLKYGQGKRVHNERGPKHKDEYRCTVCTKVKVIK